MNYSVLALDLDGTLTNAKKNITKRTKDAIVRAIQRGTLVVLASGRPVLGIERIAAELNLSKLGGYILAYNGGHIIDCKTKRNIYIRTIPRKYIHDICYCANLYNVHALTYDSNGVVAESSEAPYVIKEAYNNSIPIRQVDSLENFVNYPVVKFMIVGEPEKLKFAFEYMKKKFNGKLNIFLSEPYFIEVVPFGVEKASSIEKLLLHLGLKRESLMACGDGLNDLHMLEYAGLAVAMGNAYSGIKAVSDYITLSNEEDGVAIAIEKFILNI